MGTSANRPVSSSRFSMRLRFTVKCTASLAAIGTVVALLAPIRLLARQGLGLPIPAKAAKAATSTAKSWTTPLTAGGQPDLEGVWTNSTLIVDPPDGKA